MQDQGRRYRVQGEKRLSDSLLEQGRGNLNTRVWGEGEVGDKRNK